MHTTRCIKLCHVLCGTSVLSALGMFYSAVDSIKRIRLFHLCSLIMFVAPTMVFSVIFVPLSVLFLTDLLFTVIQVLLLEYDINIPLCMDNL